MTITDVMRIVVEVSDDGKREIVIVTDGDELHMLTMMKMVCRCDELYALMVTDEDGRCGEDSDW